MISNLNINLNLQKNNNFFENSSFSKKENKFPEKNEKVKKDTLELSTKSKENKSQNNSELTQEEQKVVNELKARDREVKAHEQAHLAAAAGLKASGPTYTYQTGPDGKKYAVGGEVQIDSSPESEPEATIRKMQKVKSAALAPAEPSAQDRAVASQAAKTEAEARKELAAIKLEESKSNFSNEKKEFGTKESKTQNKQFDLGAYFNQSNSSLFDFRF